jgi:hypothetical protein
MRGKGTGKSVDSIPVKILYQMVTALDEYDCDKFIHPSQVTDLRAVNKCCIEVTAGRDTVEEVDILSISDT